MVKYIVIICIAVVVVYSLVLAIIPHYRYYAFTSDLSETLRVSVTDRPKAVMEKILNIVEDYKIPVEKNDIQLFHKKHYMVKISWQETVNFFTIYQKTFNFHIDTTTQS